MYSVQMFKMFIISKLRYCNFLFIRERENKNVVLPRKNPNGIKWVISITKRYNHCERVSLLSPFYSPPPIFFLFYFFYIGSLFSRERAYHTFRYSKFLWQSAWVCKIPLSKFTTCRRHRQQNHMPCTNRLTCLCTEDRTTTE